MNNPLVKSIIAGIAGTAAMTLMMMLAAMLGMPKMEPPKMLAEGMGTSVAIGWVMHFMIGIVFALLYNYLIKGWLTSIASPAMKGAAFGVIAFVIAQIGMQVMGALMPNMPQPQGSMLLLALGSLMGHVLFGILVGLLSRTPTAPAV